MRWVAATGLAWHRFDDGVVLLSLATSETHLLSHSAFAVLDVLTGHPASAEDLIHSARLAAPGASALLSLDAKDVEDIIGTLYQARLLDAVADASPAAV